MTGAVVEASWVVLLLLAVGLQVLALLGRGRRCATLGASLRRIAASRTGTALLAIAWAWFGWHAFAR